MAFIRPAWLRFGDGLSRFHLQKIGYHIRTGLHSNGDR